MSWEQIILSIVAALGGGAFSSWVVTRANRKKINAETEDILSNVAKKLSELLESANLVIAHLRDQAVTAEKTIQELTISAAVEKILKDKAAIEHDSLIHRHAILTANYQGVLALQDELQKKIAALNKEDARHQYQYKMLTELYDISAKLVETLYIEIDSLRKRLGDAPEIRTVLEKINNATNGSAH